MEAVLRGTAEIVLGGEQQSGGGNHTDYGRPQNLEDALYNFVAAVGQQIAADHQDEQTGEQYHGKGTHYGAQDADPWRVAGIHHGRVAGVCGHIDADGSGGHLAHSHDVGKFLDGHPSVFFNHLVLYEGDHGVAASEVEDADFAEGIEELPENHACFLLSMKCP